MLLFTLNSPSITLSPTLSLHDALPISLLRLLAILGSEGTPVPLRRLAPEILRNEPLCLNSEDDFARTVNALVVHGLRSEEHTSELQSRGHLVCRLLLAKKKPLR